MANKAMNAFDLIASSSKLQNQFLGKNSPLSEDSKFDLFNALNSREVDKIGITTTTGIKITGFTRHGLDRVIERGIKSHAILDALKTGNASIDVLQILEKNYFYGIK